MGFLSGFGNLFGVGGNSTAVNNNLRRGLWQPGSVNFGGYGVEANTGPKGTMGPTNYTSTMDDTNTAFRQAYYGMLGQGMSGLASPQDNVGGFGGISPELLQEYMASNENTPGLPSQFYDQAGFDQLMAGAKQAGQSGFDEYNSLMANGGAGNYQHWLDVMRQAAAPQENNILQGNADKQFLQGILASTAGQYQTQGVMDSLNTADLNRQLSAYGMSQDAVNQALNRGLTATQQFQGMEGDATNRGFLLNQLAGTRASERFQRSMDLFNTGQAANQLQQQQYQNMIGVGSGGLAQQDQMMMNLFGLQGNLAAQRSAANTGAGQVQNQYMLGQQGLHASMFNQAQQTAGQIISSMMGARSGGAAASDRRLKTNIVQIGTTPGGYPWYTFDYVWGEPSFGVMADEVPASWVSYGADGYARVDYSKVI